MRLASRLLALIFAALLASVPAYAQLSAEPEGVSATVPQHETATHAVTLANAGTEPLTFCLSFDRPLQRSASTLRLAEGSAGAGEPCGPYGEVLYRYDEEDLENDTDKGGWGPYTITMTPEGRLFTAESGGLDRTFELTPDLQYVGSFIHPTVAELTPFSATGGITFDPERGTLWWSNIEQRSEGGQIVTRRILLLEGNLEGEETGSRIEVVPPDEPLEDFSIAGLSYTPALDQFYFLGISGDSGTPENWRLWAIDRAGAVPEGYPLRPEPYPDGIFISPDAHGGAGGGPGGTPGAEGVRVEYGVFVPFGPGFDRIVVVDRWGEAQGEALETPVPAALFEAGGAGINGNPLRSRIDPNGVVYMTFNNFDHEGIVGVRPHPLPPSWLVVDSDAGPEAAWDGTLAPGESREIVLTFRAGARAVGEFTASLQAFEAESGEAVEVPLVLTVTEGTDAEEEAAEPEASALSVYPNPARGMVTVAMTLDRPGAVRVRVLDVLGREVAVLHDAQLAAGSHRLTLDGRNLPSGLYVVRVMSDRFTAARRFTLVR